MDWTVSPGADGETMNYSKDVDMYRHRLLSGHIFSSLAFNSDRIRDDPSSTTSEIDLSFGKRMV